jgi:hypothetical protein
VGDRVCGGGGGLELLRLGFGKRFGLRLQVAKALDYGFLLGGG